MTDYTTKILRSNVSVCESEIQQSDDEIRILRFKLAKAEECRIERQVRLRDFQDLLRIATDEPLPAVEPTSLHPTLPESQDPDSRGFVPK